VEKNDPNSPNLNEFFFLPNQQILTTYKFQKVAKYIEGFCFLKKLSYLVCYVAKFL
jgi:hypothetical protein